jgi:hypothetical protein
MRLWAIKFPNGSFFKNENCQKIPILCERRSIAQRVAQTYEECRDKKPKVVRMILVEVE